MEVMPGYKQTEVGVIPEDWEVRRVYELVKHGPKNGYSGRSRRNSQGTPTLSLSATSTGRLVLDSQTVKYLEERISPDSDLFLNQGDILVQRSNTIDLVGTTAIFTGPPATFIYPDLMMRLRFKELASANWFWRYANSVGGRRFFMTIAAGSTGSMPKISGEKLREMPVPVPSLPEQEAIAEVLSKADALLECLERLIAKKRLFKRGVMQRFLTGKKRLPEFSGEWEMKRLGDVAEIIMGQSPRSRYYNDKGDGLPLIQGNADISDRKTIKRVFTTEITKRGRCGDILISVRAPVGEISRAIFDVCLGRGVCAIRYSNDFLYHYLIAKESTWAKLSKGSTFDSVNSTDVKAFEVELPTDEQEQTAIAAILSAMDAEIALLEAQLAKYRQLKQGLMQKLLTGRIRLV